MNDCAILALSCAFGFILLLGGAGASFFILAREDRRQRPRQKEISLPRISHEDNLKIRKSWTTAMKIAVLGD
jgi:hypothetical protein